MLFSSNVTPLLPSLSMLLKPHHLCSSLLFLPPWPVCPCFYGWCRHLYIDIATSTAVHTEQLTSYQHSPLQWAWLCCICVVLLVTSLSGRSTMYLMQHNCYKCHLVLQWSSVCHLKLNRTLLLLVLHYTYLMVLACLLATFSYLLIFILNFCFSSHLSVGLKYCTVALYVPHFMLARRDWGEPYSLLVAIFCSCGNFWCCAL